MDEDMMEHPAKRAVPSSRMVQQGLASNVPQPAGADDADADVSISATATATASIHDTDKRRLGPRSCVAATVAAWCSSHVYRLSARAAWHGDPEHGTHDGANAASCVCSDAAAPYSTASPLPDHFGPGSVMSTPMAHTPISNSPTFYLQQRHSPYKPIRHVNTLLYPPPSASLDQYHMQVPLPPTQMHYQPIGRRNDVRTGVVPEYMMYSQ